MEYVKGMYIKTIETKYGEILKVSFKKDEFLKNTFNDKGYLNTEIKRNKEGKPYVVVNEYKGEQ